MALKILIVEDDSSISDIYEILLKSQGHTTVVSLDMEEIKRQIDRVDLVISDYHMGLDFNVIVGLAKEAGIPLIAATSMAEQVHQNQVTKPFDITDLLNKIQEVMVRNPGGVK